MDCVRNELQGSSMLYQNMLEAPSGANERYTALSSRANNCVHALRVVVRAARADDDACALVDDRLLLDALGRNHSHFHRCIQPSAGVPYCINSRGFVSTGNVPVHQDADERHHRLMVWPAGRRRPSISAPPASTRPSAPS